MIANHIFKENVSNIFTWAAFPAEFFSPEEKRAKFAMFFWLYNNTINIPWLKSGEIAFFVLFVQINNVYLKKKKKSLMCI